GRNPDTGRGWPELIMPYVKSEALFVCPSDYIARQTSNQPLRSYTMNGDWYTPDCRGLSSWYTSFSEADVVNTSGTLMYMDRWAEDNLLYGRGWAVSAMQGHLRPGSGHHGLNDHLKGSNFCFADGHARWLKTTTANMWRRKPFPGGDVDDPGYTETGSVNVSCEDPKKKV
ncbi:MAG TPA: H-X9-DG-CTERM domain-containing protein, partial [Armatimonadota bacterium]